MRLQCLHGDLLMSAVGVRELKNRLTHYLQLTKKGEEVIVTERGVPIALLQPITSAKQGPIVYGTFNSV